MKSYEKLKECDNYDWKRIYVNILVHDDDRNSLFWRWSDPALQCLVNHKSDLSLSLRIMQTSQSCDLCETAFYKQILMFGDC